MESRRRKEGTRACPHRLLRVTSLLSDRESLFFLGGGAAHSRPSPDSLRFAQAFFRFRAARVGRGGIRPVARAEGWCAGAVQDGCWRVQGFAAGMENRRPARLRATAAGEKAVLGAGGRGLGMRLTVVPCNPKNYVPVWGLSFPV